MIEFFIEEVKRTDEVALIIGRNGNDPLKVGDTFNVAYRYEPCWSFDSPPTIQKQWDATLKVISIHCYNKSVEVLPKGWTGKIEVRGDTWDIGHRDVLGVK